LYTHCNGCWGMAIRVGNPELDSVDNAEIEHVFINRR
jgi:hypothetical protein